VNLRRVKRSGVPSDPCAVSGYRLLVRHRVLPALTLGVTAVLVLGVLPAGSPADAAGPARRTAVAAFAVPPAPDSTVTVDLSAPPGPRIPSDYLGLSIEATTMVQDTLDPAKGGNLVALLRSLGPGTLRLGGDSLDRDLAWQSQRTQATPVSPVKDPDWAKFVLTSADLDRLKRFLDATGWKAIVGVNLGHYDPEAAADETRQLVARLGPSLLSVEIGNEPNAYTYTGKRPPEWTVADYQGEIAAYRDAIRRVAPSVPLTGSASYPPLFLDAWAQTMAGQGTELTQHLYPLNACSPTTPTVEALLSRATARRSAANIRSGLTSAAAAGMKLRLGETNSVICSGFYGVSDVFASALWLTDHLLQAAQLGVSAVNVHGGLGICSDGSGAKGFAPYYTPLCAATQADKDAGIYRAQPEWYALQLVAGLRGTSFLPVSVAGRPNVSAYATVGLDGLVRVVVNDMDTRASQAVHRIAVRIDPSYGVASVLNLTGPSPYLPTGTRLQGAAVAPDGTLSPGAAGPLKGSAGVFTLSVRPGNAALLTLTPACSVPDLKGEIVTTAMNSLLTNGCAVGKVSKVRVRNGSHARYVVLRQHARAGSVYAPRSAVSFTLGPVKHKKVPPKATSVSAR
jgi:hypothetical protein